MFIIIPFLFWLSASPRSASLQTIIVTRLIIISLMFISMPLIRLISILSVIILLIIVSHVFLFPFLAAIGSVKAPQTLARAPSAILGAAFWASVRRFERVLWG